MPDNTINWGQGAVNNTNDWGKAKANSTNNFGAVYDSSPSGDTNLTGGSAGLAQVNNVYSMEFDGVNDSIVLPDTVDLGVNSSISVWVNLDTNYTGVLLGCEPYDSHYLIQARYNDFFVRIGSVYESFPLTDNALTAGSWHHLVVTRSGDSISTYVDGIFIETKTGYGTSVTTKFDTIADRQTSSLPLEGKIDELAGFNVTLTAQEVQNIYDATETGKTADLNDLTTPPIAWYRMGD